MNPDPLATNSRPMKYTDAVIVATVLTILMISTAFLPAHSYDMLVAEPDRYFYDLMVFALQNWTTTFCGLTGLIVYAKKREARESQ